MNDFIKVFGSNTFVAILFMLGVATAGAIGQMIVGQGLKGNLGDLGTASNPLNIIMILWVLLSIFIIGALGYGLYRANHFIRHNIFKVPEMDAETAKMPKRVTILGIFVFGLAISVLLYAFNSFVQSIDKNVDITSLASLQYAYTSGNLWLMISIIIAVAITGYILVFLGRRFGRIQEGTEDAIKGLKP